MKGRKKNIIKSKEEGEKKNHKSKIKNNLINGT